MPWTKGLSMKAMIKTYLCIVSLIASADALSNPTSKEYVDAQIKETVRTLREQMSQQNKSIDAHIKEMNESVQTQIQLMQHEIGESYQGGIIFWVDKSKQHGLVVAKKDAFSSGLQWQNGESGEKITNALANGLFSGLANTYLIVSQQTIDNQEGQFAALSATNFSVLEDGISPCSPNKICYGNWFLPSVSELQQIKKNIYDKGLGFFSQRVYWSSTEANVTQAYAFDLSTGQLMKIDKSQDYPRVRPVHAF